MSISSCNELCSIKFSSSYWVLILYYIHALISGIDNLSSLRGYAIEVAKCSRCLPEFSITRCERFLGSRIWHVFFQVVLWLSSLTFQPVFDTVLIQIRYLMGRATLKGRFWVQLLSEPQLSSSTGWKMLDLRRTCLCLQLFSHALVLINLPTSVHREGGLIKWGIFTVDLSRQILPKRPY